MTDNQEDKKVKKLTLGGTKLSLGNYPKKVAKTLGGSGSIVVEVKRGKAAAGGLSLNRNSSAAVNIDQNDRRMQALQRSKAVKDEDSQISSLSKLAEINQEPKIDESLAVAAPVDETTGIEKAPVSRKDHVKKADPAPAVSLHKEKVEEEKEKEKEAPAKPKTIEPKKLKKSDIINMLEEDSGRSPFKTRSLASIKRARAKEKRKNSSGVKVEKVYREVILPEVITVAELANRMTERAADVTRELMKMGVMANSTQSIDADTAELIATSFGHSVKRVKESDIEDVLQDKNDSPEDLQPRAPIVTVMGHVDHGKTSLLDALKSTDIVADEAGGITQHIGAYTIEQHGKPITFLDTPGHAAFSHMRQRGTDITDIIIIVVAADDGVKPQTVEVIKLAKESGVPVIVALNKMDKETAQPDMVKGQMAEHGMNPVDWGGDIEFVPVSAKSGMGIDDLLENILLTADVLELKANENALAKAAVVESSFEKGRGPVATVIVQNGTLKVGDYVVCGCAYGRVKALIDENNKQVKTLVPSHTAQVAGLNEVPASGEVMIVMCFAKGAKEFALKRHEYDRHLKNQL